MSSLEHPNAGRRDWLHPMEPEYAILVLVTAFAVGLALTLPWW
jgi:hypothetical protein